MATLGTRNRFAGQGDRIADSGVDKWINIFGDVQVIEGLGRLSTAVERSMLRKAIAKGLKPIVRIAKANVPVKTGLLRKAIKSAVTKMVSGKVYVDPKVFSVKSKAAGTVRVFEEYGPGSKTGYKKSKAMILASTPDSEIDKPAKYAHIVEFGGPKHRNPTPFMRPALDAGRNEALDIIANEFREQLNNFKFK